MSILENCDLITHSLSDICGSRDSRAELSYPKSVFSPVVRSIGRTAVKAATSGAAKTVGKALKEQALTSAVNLGIDAIRGTDLQESLDREVNSARRKAADTLDDIRGKKRKPTKKVTKVVRRKKGSQRDFFS